MTATETEVLLRVQLAGVVDREVAHSWPVDERTIAGLVAQEALASDDGLLYVTETGDRLLTRLLRVDPVHETALLAFFDDFTPLDIELKATLTEWQRARREDDPDGQLAALESWLDLDSRLSAAATDAVRTVIGRYLDLLAVAREAVLDGRPDELSGAGDTSYHSAWFMLHEVLIRSLGRSRADAPAAAGSSDSADRSPTGPMHITVDRDRCFGYARCIDVAPDTFSLDENGSSVPRDSSDDEQTIRAAAWACPVQAIEISDARS